MKTIAKQLKELEKKWGIEAWNDILDLLGKQQLKIEELTKSRENWKLKYKRLKDKNDK